jgi:hypothetical protein
MNEALKSLIEALTMDEERPATDDGQLTFFEFASYNV